MQKRQENKKRSNPLIHSPMQMKYRQIHLKENETETQKKRRYNKNKIWEGNSEHLRKKEAKNKAILSHWNNFLVVHLVFDAICGKRCRLLFRLLMAYSNGRGALNIRLLGDSCRSSAIFCGENSKN